MAIKYYCDFCKHEREGREIVNIYFPLWFLDPKGVSWFSVGDRMVAVCRDCIRAMWKRHIDKSFKV